MKTHRLLVSAYILKEDRFLLLHRNHPPLIWAPPGGHLEVDEHPHDGLRREVHEETSLEIDIVAPANIWYGDLGKGPSVSIDFACHYRSGEIQLSSEHENFRWSTLEQLRGGNPDLGQGPLSFQLEHFEMAYRLLKR